MAKRNRHEHDRYETDVRITNAMLDMVPVAGTVFEPCAGNGLMAGALARRPFITSVKTNDIDKAMPTDMHFDATKGLLWPQAEWVITNPPFGQAPGIARNALRAAKTGVALHLRLSFYEPCRNRRDLLQGYADHMTHIIPINPRGQWRDDTNGGDKVTTAWFVWQFHHSWTRLGVSNPFQFIVGWR